jgi:hypothetical protein
MLTRLLLGLVKGIVIGALGGFALGQLGMAVPGALGAYLAAVVVGVLVAAIAGKPLWRKDALVEVGTKAITAALLAPALMFVARRWLTMGVPFDPALLGAAAPRATALGALAVTALAMVGGVLGGFFELDNSERPKPDKSGAARDGAGGAGAGSAARIAGSQSDGAAADSEVEQADAAAPRKQKR